ncbi:hypothetical protein GOBAR_DD36189 [Gossypium barbadense]|nr:hypothetical protein GOBAR_DD36189 [Gossypium barbadense]
MSNVGFLEFQYKLSQNKFMRKPLRLFSRDRQNSGLLTAYQPDLDELRKVFDKFDSNKDGKISQMEYKAMLRALGQGSMTQDVPKIFQLADFDGDGFINFKDFVEVHKRSGGVTIMDIQNAFHTFDLNCERQNKCRGSDGNVEEAWRELQLGRVHENGESSGHRW